MATKKKILDKANKKTKLSNNTYNFIGLATGTFFYSVSMLPSLLPRPWIFQAIISGFSFAVGYGLGVFLSFLIRWMLQKPIPKSSTTSKKAWKALKSIGLLAIVISSIVGVMFQNEIRILVDRREIGVMYALPIIILAFLVAKTSIDVARFLRKIHQKIITKINVYVPTRVSIVAGTLVIFLLFSWVSSGLFEIFFVKQSNRIYNARNNTTPEGVIAPLSKYRSGSPESLVTWDSLGFQGKNFIGSGPTQKQLAAFTESENVKEPIRVYAGVKVSESVAERSRLAVEELKRTGAFSRKVLVIANVTGTGWLEPQTVDALEYMYGGDTAIVAQQYSYLPSWISFLVDKSKATETGASLFDAVRSEWIKQPAETRPKIITYGLSLGSYSAQAAFSGVNDVALSTDGALFVGTPSDTLLWNTVTKNRDKGSPQVLPIYKNGDIARFASNNTMLEGDKTGWQKPRVLYLQHASDPVVWFDFNLVLHKPDWLREPKGTGVSKRMRWYPFVTFAQVGVDQFFGTTVPNGHGHNYPDIIVNAWAAVVAPQDWTFAKSEKLQTIINSYINQ